MRAAVAVAPGRTEIREFEVPLPDAASGVLRVATTGVCGSDWGYYQSLPRARGPLILGHETVGHVESMGALAAQRWGVKEGDLVALEEYLPCGHCEFCRTGEFRLCDATDWRLGGHAPPHAAAQRTAGARSVAGPASRLRLSAVHAAGLRSDVGAPR